MAEDSAQGVSAHDPRNARPIAFFRPPAATEKYVRDELTAVSPNKTAAEIERLVSKFMLDMAAGTFRAPPPMSEPPANTADPKRTLGTHPDIIEAIWKLDSGLPHPCRWTFWGRPALVHPETGVVFAVGIGSIGYVMRLPPWVMASLPPDSATVAKKLNFGREYSIEPAGPEWRFILPAAPADEWVKVAFDYAGESCELHSPKDH